MPQMQSATIGNSRRNGSLEIALPEPALAMEQDAEWCVVRIGDEWRQIRFHDYHDVYALPGLYERLFYDILQCDSPATVRRLLEKETHKGGTAAEDLRVLDLGAGNGMVGEEFAEMGARSIVGVDIIAAAAEAAERDRPGVYEEYVVTDMANLSDRPQARLAAFKFNCLACGAALRFGDIPPEAFAQAYNLVSDGGWIVFNIKEDFLNGKDTSGFSELIAVMRREGVLSICSQKRYRHRLATNGDPLFYVAMVGVKKQNISSDVVP